MDFFDSRADLTNETKHRLAIAGLEGHNGT